MKSPHCGNYELFNHRRWTACIWVNRIWPEPDLRDLALLKACCKAYTWCLTKWESFFCLVSFGPLAPCWFLRKNWTTLCQRSMIFICVSLPLKEIVANRQLSVEPRFLPCWEKKPLLREKKPLKDDLNLCQVASIPWIFLEWSIDPSEQPLHPPTQLRPGAKGDQWTRSQRDSSALLGE